MILIDFTQIAIGSLMVALHQAKSKEVDENLVRHLVLNNIRYYRSRFKEKYGELVICCDSRHYWRRDYFPQYKATRKKERESSSLDWDVIFTTLNFVRDEIKKHFPYKVVEVYGAEADDIIAVLTRERNDDITVIVSSDKDFIQLHNNIIDQYSPVTKKFLTHVSPKVYLSEHILKGDRSDGVPNILSPDDTFTENKRQKPMRKAVISDVLDQMTAFDVEQLYMLAKCPRDTWIRNWQRNETLIDLTKIPSELQENIVQEYDNVKIADRSKLYGYFVEKKLSKLIQSIGDF